MPMIAHVFHIAENQLRVGPSHRSPGAQVSSLAVRNISTREIGHTPRQARKLERSGKEEFRHIYRDSLLRSARYRGNRLSIMRCIRGTIRAFNQGS
jgi:hypothetical protein